MVFSQFTEVESFKTKGDNFSKDIFNNNMYYDKQLDKYDLYYLELDLNISDQTTYLMGSAKLFGKSTKSLDTLIIELNNSMTVDSIIFNNIKISHIHQNHQIQYILDEELDPNIQFTAQVFYKGTPDPNGRGVTNGYDSNWAKKMTWTLSESFHAYEWWPCKQVLSDKIDSSLISLTCDDDCMAGSNGLLIETKTKPNNKKQYIWKSNYPINYYLISFAVAEYQDYSLYAYPTGSDPILIQNFVYDSPNYLNNNKSDIDKTASMIELFSERFGLYPFAKEKYGHCLTTLGGGMEHQTMSTMGAFYYNLVSHELGHMWFGDYVTCATWQDIWINEGFASYTEYVALQYLVSQLRADEWIEDAQTRALTQPYGSVYVPFGDAFNESRIFNYSLSYKKGACIIHTLRHQINNDEIFFTSLQAFLNEYGNDVASGEDFKGVIEAETGIDFETFFDQWYYGYGYPTFNIQYSQLNDTLYLNVQQETSSNKTPLFQLHVEYKLQYTGGDTTLSLYQSSNNETFKILIDKEVKNIVVDPKEKILKAEGTVRKLQSPIEEQYFYVFPNPAKDQIRLKFNVDNSEENNSIKVFDASGRLLIEKENYVAEETIDISNLNSGLYFIKFFNGNGSDSRKFLKL